MSLLRVVCASACTFSLVMSAGAAAARTLKQYGEVSARRAAPSATPGCLPAVLKSALARVRAACGQAQVVSTHRPGARIAGTGRRSYHASCRAVDFNAPHGCALKVLAGWPGGLGVYSGGMRHLHLDNGPRVRFAHGGGRGAAKTRYARRDGGRYAVRRARSYRYAARTSRGYRTAARSERSYRHAVSSARRWHAVRHVRAKVRSARQASRRTSWRARRAR